MCDPVTLMLAGVAASGIGSVVSNGIQQKNALKIQNANNRILDDTLERNRREAEQARSIFDERISWSEDSEVQPQLETTQQNKIADVLRNLGSGPEVAPGVTPSAPQVIKDAFAKRLQDVFNESTAKGTAQARLSGFGGLLEDRAYDNSAAIRGSNLFTDRIAGNLAILPSQQQFEALQVSPNFDWGAIIRGAGDLATSAATGGFGGKSKGPINIVPKGY